MLGGELNVTGKSRNHGCCLGLSDYKYGFRASVDDEETKPCAYRGPDDETLGIWLRGVGGQVAYGHQNVDKTCQEERSLELEEECIFVEYVDGLDAIKCHGLRLTIF